jgi:hypothetical protein
MMPKTPEDKILGIGISCDPHLSRWEIVDAEWEFPFDPFVTYEERDIEWCSPLKIGKLRPKTFKSGEVVIREGVGEHTSMSEYLRAVSASACVVSAMDNLYYFRVKSSLVN